MELIRRTQANLPPEHICEVYNNLGGGQSKVTIAGLWKDLADATVTCIADGMRTLALLWESAYTNGGGKTVFSSVIAPAALKITYEDKPGKLFLVSLDLANMDPANYVIPSGVGAAKKAPKPKLVPQMALSKKRNHAQPKLRKRA